MGACPGNDIDTTPANPHIHMELLFKAGVPPNKTVGDPGVQAAVIGVHGMGVNTPSAAAVAVATAGFAILVHKTNGVISAKGVADIILLPGARNPMEKLNGSVSRALGATPKLHIFMVCATESIAISLPLS